MDEDLLKKIRPDEPGQPERKHGLWKKWIGPVLFATGGFMAAQFTPDFSRIDEFFAEPVRDVMGDMRATPVSLEHRFYIANVIGVKLRDCPVKSGSFVGWAHDKAWRITAFEFVDNPKSNSRRPTGFQDFGFWQWAIKPNDTAVKLTLIHQCLDGEVHTEVGPFFIPRAIKIGEA